MVFHDTNLPKKPDFTGILRTGYHSTAQDLTALWNSNPTVSAKLRMMKVRRSFFVSTEKPHFEWGLPKVIYKNYFMEISIATHIHTGRV